jgi:hypothetical protein
MGTVSYRDDDLAEILTDRALEVKKIDETGTHFSQKIEPESP